MRYKNAVAVLIKILAVLTICGGIILFTMMDSIGRTNYGLAVMLGAFVSETMLLGFSEIIRLLHEINQKTR